jgi:uncharacterized protein involved in propanediol utilization
MTTVAVTGVATGIGQRHGTGVSFGTFGELLQGALAGTDQDFLVTLPIMRWSVARIGLAPGATELRVEPGHKHKALAVARSVLSCHGVAHGGRLVVTSELPEGKGMASSSADLVATIRAVGKAIGRPVTPRTAEAFLRLVEPTDGLMYRDVVAYYHRRVQLCRTLAPPPPLTIVGLDEGGQVDTVRFNASRPAIDAREQREYASLLDRLGSALARGDLATLGWVATRSAVLNQARCHKRHLGQMLEIRRFVRALGVVVAHSGTVLGLLISDADPDYPRKVADATAACRELAGNVSVDHTLGSTTMRRVRISVE